MIKDNKVEPVKQPANIAPASIIVALGLTGLIATNPAL